jgi:uncharacterized protein with HEPN domain
VSRSLEEREKQRLQYIRQSIQRVEEYIRDGRETFLREPLIQDAVLRRLETLADASNLLSDTLKARHPSVPRRQIYGFRNLAAHAYEEVDIARIWDIVQNSVPPLKAVVDKELGR